jgi:transcription initiation factor TFIIIB Brf1 subunit/transcription initiation factor TFIIB
MNSLNNIEDLNGISIDDIREMFDGMDFNNFNISDTNITTHETIDKKPKQRELKCNGCQTNDNIIEDTSNGFMVCKNCGQVVEGLMDFGPERHNYENDTTQDTRTSMAINKLLPTSSLGTQISGGNWKSHMRRLHEWNIMPYRERSLSYVFKELSEKCKKAGLLKCIEDDAKIMYKTISECKHTKGKNLNKNIIIRGINRRSLIAACIFFACRRKSMTRSPKEIADLFQIKYTDMTKGCKNFLKLFNIKQKGMNIGTSQPDDFVLRFSKELKFKQEYVDQAITIAKNIKKLSISTDHNPYSIAIASILLVGEINKLTNISKKQLGVSFGVSEVTITKTYKKIEKYKYILINNDLTDKMVKDQKQKIIEIGISDKLKERFKKYNIDPMTGVELNKNESPKEETPKNIIEIKLDEIEKQEIYGDDKEEMYEEEYYYGEDGEDGEILEEMEYFDPNLYKLYNEIENINKKYIILIENYKLNNKII